MYHKRRSSVIITEVGESGDYCCVVLVEEDVPTFELG
jgi:hypothetical protein